MTTTTHDTEMARAHLEEAREHFEAFQDAMRALGREVRRLDEWQWHRVDAYPGWEGTRDVGAGVDMTGWLDEVEAFLDGQDEAKGDDPDVADDVEYPPHQFRSHDADAWGECLDCGRTLDAGSHAGAPGEDLSTLPELIEESLREDPPGAVATVGRHR